MTIESTSRSPGSPICSVRSRLACSDNRAHVPANEPIWHVESCWADTGSPVSTSFSRLERITIGAGLRAYALVGRTTREDGDDANHVVLLDPSDLTVAACVSYWMLSGLPGQPGAACNISLSDLDDSASLTPNIRNFANFMFSEVTSQLARSGRLEQLIANELGLAGHTVCAVASTAALAEGDVPSFN